MRGLVMMLARFAVWLAKREAARHERHVNEPGSRDCMCDACQWERGLSDEADAAFGREWRP